jgi:hypothetical protein
MNLNHHQWKLVYDAVRKQQVNSIVNGSSYKEYDAILNELWDLAYYETYANIEIVEQLTRNDENSR